MSWGELIMLGVGLSIGAMLGLAGVILVLPLFILLILSRMIERLRSTILAARQRLGLTAPTA